MASSQFNMPQRIKYIDVELNNFTIAANGSTSITNPTTPSGYELLTAVVYRLIASGGLAVPQVEGRGMYVYGTPSATYYLIVLRFIYVKI